MLLESALADLSDADSCSLVMENDNSSAQSRSDDNPVEEKPAVESENHDAEPITTRSSESSTDRSLQIHHRNEDFTPRRLSEREKQISVDPQSLQNSRTSPGSVPFEWEMEPGVPKIKVRVPVFSGPLQLPPARIVLEKDRAPSSAGSSATPSPRSISGLIRSMLKPKGSVLHTCHSHSSNRNHDNYNCDYDATVSSDECTNSNSSPVSILYPHFERAQLDSSLRVLARQRSLALARAVDSHYVAELRKARSCNVQTSAAVVSAGIRDDRVLMKSKSKRRNGNSYRNGGSDYHGENIVARADSLSRTGLEFTCGGICSFLPFAKQKPKQEHDDGVDEERIDVPAGRVVIMRRQSSVQSLEKIDCGDSIPSRPTSMIHADEQGGSKSSHLYFERPNEIFVESSNEAFSPVAAAFVFDGDRRCPPSVLKKNINLNKSRQTASRKASRHVRFSVDTDGHLSSSDSSSSCNVSPRLRRQREEFNSYLAAETHHSP